MIIPINAYPYKIFQISISVYKIIHIFLSFVLACKGKAMSFGTNYKVNRDNLYTYYLDIICHNQYILLLSAQQVSWICKNHKSPSRITNSVKRKVSNFKKWILNKV